MYIKVVYINREVKYMSKKKKLISRLLSKPKDFSYKEAATLLNLSGYILANSGKTSGSRVSFVRGNKVFRLHKPHPRNELLSYQINELINELEQEGLL